MSLCHWQTTHTHALLLLILSSERTNVRIFASFVVRVQSSLVTGANVGYGTSSADAVEGKNIFHLIIQLMPCAWLRASVHCEKFFKIDGIAHFVDKAVRLAIVVQREGQITERGISS